MSLRPPRLYPGPKTGLDATGVARQRRGKARKWRRRIVWSVIAATQAGMLITILVLVAALVLATESWKSHGGEMSAQEVAEALRTGQIHQGMDLPVGKLPKPWVDGTAHGDYPSGSWTSVYVIRNHTRVVLLYYQHEGKLFAACTIEASPNWDVTWHFCDTDLLKTHIEQSQRSYPIPMLKLMETGADPKQRSPLLVVWPDGVLAISARFPHASPEFRVGRLNAATLEALGAALRRFGECMPVPSSAGEEKVRMSWSIVVEGTLLSQMIEFRSATLPLCFVGGDCPDRFGAEAAAAWEQIERSFEGAAGGELPDPYKRRAKNYWEDHGSGRE